MKKHILIPAMLAMVLMLSADSVVTAPLRQHTAATTLDTPQWTDLCDDAVATVYNAVPEQCNADVLHTASMYRLNPDDVASQRVLAMERTMMQEYGITYGDIVRVSGAGDLDGLWRVEDTMNRRYRGQHKIDFLVPATRKTGKWNGVTVSVPANKPSRHMARRMLASL